MAKRKIQKMAQREDNLPTVDEKEKDLDQEEQLSMESSESGHDQDNMVIDDSAENDDNLVSDEASSEEELQVDSEDIDDESDESKEEEKKKRGRRQVLFCCSGVQEVTDEAGDVSLVAFQEEIPVTMPADEEQKLDTTKGRDEVIHTFESKHGYKPHDVRGPFYFYKGIAVPQRKRETLNQTIAREAPFTTERGTAVHHLKNVDWKVIVNFTERPDTVFVFYDSLMDPKQVPKDKTNKLQKPSPKFLPISSLRDIQKSS